VRCAGFYLCWKKPVDLATRSPRFRNPKCMGESERVCVFCLLKGIAEGTYKAKHAEAAKLYYREFCMGERVLLRERGLFIERYRRGHLQHQAHGSR